MNEDTDLYSRHHRQHGSSMADYVQSACDSSTFSRSQEATGDTSSASLESSTSDASLYAILGVPRDASASHIKSAYRSLVQTLHPDKIQDPQQKHVAQEEFIKIQEAYDVLKNPSSRNVYDVYGLEGIRAGMELSTVVVDPQNIPSEEQRRQFEEYMKIKKKKEEDMVSQQKGMYVFKTDATSMMGPYGWEMPQVTTVYMSTGLDIPLENDESNLHVGGVVTSSDGQGGGGSFVAGYSRFFQNGAQAGVEGSVGLQTLVGAQVAVPLSAIYDGLSKKGTAASIFATGGVTWSPDAGVTVDLGTSCQISAETSGEFGWTVYPSDLSTMSLTLKHKMESMLITAKAEIGVVIGITCRIVRQITNVLSARVSLKATTAQGIEFEVGGNRRLSEAMMAGMGIATGLPSGVMLRLRFHVSGHNFEFPILLSRALDPWFILGAHIIPPSLVAAMTYGIIRPVYTAMLDRKMLSEKAKKADSIAKALQASRETCNVIRQVALRKLQEEIEKDGLVIAKALYGDPLLLSTLQPETLDFDVKEPEDILREGLSVADVTVPVQYMCDNDKSEVVFYAGYPKSNLLGFFDPAPGTKKILLVIFKHRGIWKKAVFDDTEGGRIPAKGIVLDDELIIKHLSDTVLRVDNPLFVEQE